MATHTIDKRVYSGAPWEERVHYCRARRRGPFIAVAGTVAVDERGNALAEDAYGQAKAVFSNIARALEACGASLADVVRTRMYVTRFEDFDAVARAHGETFSSIDPAATCIVVSGLVAPELLVEIEADAYTLS